MLWVVTLSGFLPSFTSSSVVWVNPGPGHTEERREQPHLLHGRLQTAIMARKTNRREFVQVAGLGGVGINGGCPAAGRGCACATGAPGSREPWARAFAH